MRNILFVYNLSGLKRRKTVDDSIFCFKDNGEDKIYFYNFWKRIGIWNVLSHYKFDAVIFHYTFMALRASNLWEGAIFAVKKINCDNLAVIVEDEYIYSKQVNEFIKELKVKTVFTLARGDNIRIIYPNIDAAFYSVLPGYVNTDSLSIIKKLQRELEGEENTIDIGYRARKVGYSLGKQGNLKIKVAEMFNEALSSHEEIKADIANTGDTRNVFLGMDWYRFLIRCRTMLGCLGGASILDTDGGLYSKIEDHLRKHPEDDDFEKIAKLYLPKDGEIDYSSFSPRFFECAMTKTCQVLIEGDYGGVLIPDVHFIKIKRDFSNIEDVIGKIKDKEYCEKVADRAYKDLVESGKYSYERYVEYVLEKIPKSGKNCLKMNIYWEIKIILKVYDLLLKINDLRAELARIILLKH